MAIRLEKYSYRFAEQLLNSKLSVKQEVEDILTGRNLDLSTLSRPGFNNILDSMFTAKGWERQPMVFDEPGDPSAKMDFLKDRIGVEVAFGHPSFIGIDLLKFQVASYSGLDKIDAGIYVTTTRKFQNYLIENYGLKWNGSLTYEKVVKYIPHFKSAIQVPIYVLGIDI